MFCFSRTDRLWLSDVPSEPKNTREHTWITIWITISEHQELGSQFGSQKSLSSKLPRSVNTIVIKPRAFLYGFLWTFVMLCSSRTDRLWLSDVPSEPIQNTRDTQEDLQITRMFTLVSLLCVRCFLSSMYFYASWRIFADSHFSAFLSYAAYAFLGCMLFLSQLRFLTVSPPVCSFLGSSVLWGKRPRNRVFCWTIRVADRWSAVVALCFEERRGA